MPTICELFSSVYYSAGEIPPTVWDVLRSNARNSNVILPHAEKTLQEERSTGRSRESQLWITCGVKSAVDPVDFVASVTEGPLGSYPIFLFTCHPLSVLDADLIYSRMRLLTATLRERVQPERVYSVFGLDPVVRVFAEFWRELTGISDYLDPYYAAKLTYCTKSSFINRQPTIHSDVTYELRRAVEEDIWDTAKLCYGFARKSEPFVLTRSGAINEATQLVENGQLWVHTILRPGRTAEIASIVAVTRESESVSAITKVYTNPDWRRRGCAERLVRHVCKHLLKTKESVVLYVAHNNPAARKVYHRVGFIGLDESKPDVEGVDSWLEIGFDRGAVDLGHW